MSLGPSSPAGIRDSVTQEKGRGVAEDKLRRMEQSAPLGRRLGALPSGLCPARSFESWRLLRQDAMQSGMHNSYTKFACFVPIADNRRYTYVLSSGIRFREGTGYCARNEAWRPNAAHQ